MKVINGNGNIEEYDLFKRNKTDKRREKAFYVKEGQRFVASQ